MTMRQEQLLNEQGAEIERLDAENQRLREENARLSAQNRTLHDEMACRDCLQAELAKVTADRDEARAYAVDASNKRVEAEKAAAEAEARIMALEAENKTLRAQRDTGYGYGRDGGEPPWMK